VKVTVTPLEGTERKFTVAASWSFNSGVNSYWSADLGSFARGDEVSYTLLIDDPGNLKESAGGRFRVGPRLYFALLWHQHQPLYRDTSRAPRGSFLKPWVRLHALRDYYAMPLRVAAYPRVHLTFNLTPSLLIQILDYAEKGATDEALDLTLTPAESLSESERARILSSFFDADRNNQIARHARYAELLAMQEAGTALGVGDLRDLQMWFNLAWFAEEFRQGPVDLVTGEVVSVHKFVEKQRNFSREDIETMVAQQQRILRAIVPLHRRLQDNGQIEVSTSPFYHPILPLLMDSNRATLDLPGASLPSQYAHPEDADAQVASAVELHRNLFGRPPTGMWPSEGAVAQFVIPILARHGIAWICTDEGVLSRSGTSYDTSNPDVLCRPYRVGGAGGVTSIFFRATRPSDQIGFDLAREPDYAAAAAHFLDNLRSTYARAGQAGDDRVLAIVLDGENAWGTYREDGRPFLDALYRLLDQDREIETVTFTEYLKGDSRRCLLPHGLSEQREVLQLFTGSWIDEEGSARGVDLGTWIGEPEENRAWELLRATRERVKALGATPQSAPHAFQALYAAEGSDWFWWLGRDQNSGYDRDFDDMFRMHLRNVYRFLGVEHPPELDRPITD
jgi:alpha-amylase/alpha-mannosidase (GH57 family)